MDLRLHLRLMIAGLSSPAFARSQERRLGLTGPGAVRRAVVGARRSRREESSPDGGAQKVSGNTFQVVRRAA